MAQLVLKGTDRVRCQDMLTPIDAPIDDLADLSSSEWENLKEWYAASCGPARRLMDWTAGRFTSRQNTSNAVTSYQSRETFVIVYYNTRLRLWSSKSEITGVSKLAILKRSATGFIGSLTQLYVWRMAWHSTLPKSMATRIASVE